MRQFIAPPFVQLFLANKRSTFPTHSARERTLHPRSLPRHHLTMGHRLWCGLISGDTHATTCLARAMRNKTMFTSTILACALIVMHCLSLSSLTLTRNVDCTCEPRKRTPVTFAEAEKGHATCTLQVKQVEIVNDSRVADDCYK